MVIAEVLRTARQKAGLEESVMARWVGIDDSRLRELEAGALPHPEELDSYATALGLGVEELVGGACTDSPVFRLLFRAAEDQLTDSLDRLVETDSHRVFGDFLRVVRELEQLHPTAHAQPLPRPTVALPSGGAAYREGAELSAWLRKELELGIEPIASMRELLRTLGVATLFVLPEELDPTIDGASTSQPRPAILVNLVEGPDCWWRTRMTLAHELCHLLVDHHGSDQPAATLSPWTAPRRPESGRPRRLSLYEGFDRVESRASAFAAHFLAPEQGIRDAVGTGDPTSEQAIATVGQKFGVGRIVACHRLMHVYRFSEKTHREMLARATASWRDSEERTDRVAAHDIGLRGGEFQRAVLEALADGKIDRAEAYEHLRLPFTEKLPEHPRLTDDQRAPLRTVDTDVRGVAQAYLERELPDEHLAAADVFGGGSEGWRVKVLRLPSSEHEGDLVVSYDRIPQRFVRAVPAS